MWSEDTHGTGLIKLATKLKKSKLTLNKWNKEIFARVDVTIHELQTRLIVLEDWLQTDWLQTDHAVEMEEDYLGTKAKLNYWKKRGEIWVSQIAKKKLIQEWDQNTKYFHAVIRQKKLSKYWIN